MGCPNRTVVPCTGGDGSPCQTPPVVVACALELECSESVPEAVFYWPAISSDGSVGINIEGDVVGQSIQVMIKEKYDAGGADAFRIIDIVVAPDVDAPDIAVITVGGGSLEEDVIYTAFARRIDANGVASPWTYDLFSGTLGTVVVIVDNQDVMVDDDGTTPFLDD